MAEAHDRRSGDDRPDGRGETESARRRRRQLAEIFGDVLPEQTSDDGAGFDERAGGQPERSGGTPDAWLRREVPPHHGG